jgi:hypothetical protein
MTKQILALNALAIFFYKYKINLYSSQINIALKITFMIFIDVKKSLFLIIVIPIRFS